MWVWAESGGWKSNLQSIVIVNLIYIYIIMYETPAMKMIFGNYYCTAMVLNP